MSSERALAAMVLGIVAPALAGAGGCARTVAEQSLVEQADGAIDDLDYWERLAETRSVTVNDALHGLFIAADGEAPHADYEARLFDARSRGWVGANDDPPPAQVASVGMVAVAVCDILDVEGGLSMRLFGPAPRSCTRELVYMEVLPRRTYNQALTGLEFIDVLRRVEQRLDPPPPPGTAGSGNRPPDPATNEASEDDGPDVSEGPEKG